MSGIFIVFVIKQLLNNNLAAIIHVDSALQGPAVQFAALEVIPCSSTPLSHGRGVGGEARLSIVAEEHLDGVGRQIGGRDAVELEVGAEGTDAGTCLGIVEGVIGAEEQDAAVGAVERDGIVGAIKAYLTALSGGWAHRLVDCHVSESRTFDDATGVVPLDEVGGACSHIVRRRIKEERKRTCCFIEACTIDEAIVFVFLFVVVTLVDDLSILFAH